MMSWLRWRRKRDTAWLMVNAWWSVGQSTASLRKDSVGGLYAGRLDSSMATPFTLVSASKTLRNLSSMMLSLNFSAHEITLNIPPSPPPPLLCLFNRPIFHRSRPEGLKEEPLGTADANFFTGWPDAVRVTYNGSTVCTEGIRGHSCIPMWQSCGLRLTVLFLFRQPLDGAQNRVRYLYNTRLLQR